MASSTRPLYILLGLVFRGIHVHLFASIINHRVLAALRQTPLIERKENLRRLVEVSECSEIIVKRDGKLLFQEVCERNLEGSVCKTEEGRLRGAWLVED